ncbi:hypothetical protein DFH29DRAFT_988390 [Suillus ampliporus]|nr:hypothetical protein DFH29DRAFT_988390 [Suillus ampliporus]
MARRSLHQQYIASYVQFMAFRALFQPARTPEDLAQELNMDVNCIIALQQTRYLRSRPPVLKSGNLHLAWEWAHGPSDHQRFINMLRVSPEVFQVILGLIEDHPVFHNNSNQPQEPVEIQLGVTLYRMGRYGNGASLEDIARTAGCFEGSLEKYTERKLLNRFSLESVFIRCTTRKTWVRQDWIESQHPRVLVMLRRLTKPRINYILACGIDTS